jgi:prepilin-type N-terminal cleavage/methylation domain-containing protein
MKLIPLRRQGFTLAEMVLALGIGSLMLVAAVGTSICLQRSFSAVDDFFASHLQQVRIIDYLSRDVKRSYIVTSSTDLQTVTCIVPNYLITSSGSQPTRATPKLSLVGNKIVANYQATTVNYITTTQGSATISCAGLPVVSGSFDSTTQAGKSIVGTGIPAGTTLVSFSGCVVPTQCTGATMSNPATADGSSVTVTIGALTNVIYSVDILNKTIRRTENGALTNIASSADKLLPNTTNVQLSNTEFTQSTVTFLPRFISMDRSDNTATNNINERAGTTIFSLSYLRNKRRGDG